jgi:hypothetical protein
MFTYHFCSHFYIFYQTFLANHLSTFKKTKKIILYIRYQSTIIINEKALLN